RESRSRDAERSAGLHVAVVVSSARSAPRRSYAWRLACNRLQSPGESCSSGGSAMKLCRVFGVMVIAVFAAQVTAQDAVTIKFADPKPGDRIKVTEEETANVTTSFVIDGKPQKKDEKA